MSENAKLFTLNRAPNPNAAYSVGNAVAFADAAGTAPVDGNGGSPTVTITRTTSTPLEGNASYLFTKDAANRQGEGWSEDYILQPSDATKMFTLNFDYQITTGTYTGYQAPPLFSDLTAWVYDVTNSVMYQVQGYQLDGAVSTTNQYSFRGQWQVPVGCLRARLIYFLGNTTTVAFTARFNNLSFGREPSVQGTVSTPWKTYTTTVAGLGAGSGTAVAQWSRTGSSVSVSIIFTKDGTPGSGAANVTFSLPSDFQIDLTALSAAGSDVNGGVAYTFAVEASAQNSTSSVRLLSGTPQLAAVFNVAGAGNLYQGADFRAGSIASILISNLPVIGWGANGTLGQDAATQVTGAYYNGQPVLTTVASGFTTVIIPTVITDTSSAYSAGFFTVPVAGLYNGSFGARIVGTFALNNNYGIRVMAGTTALATFDSTAAGAVTVQAVITSFDGVYILAGTQVSMQVYTQATLPTFGTGANNWFSIARVSGPAQVQAPEIITARYSTNAGQSISTATVTILDFEDKSYDDHGCVTTGASWKFTCPRTGKVRVSAAAALASNAGWSANEGVLFYIYKNGAEYSRQEWLCTVTSTQEVNATPINDEVDVLAGDFIDIRLQQTSGGTIALQTSNVKNYVAINYVGGIG